MNAAGFLIKQLRESPSKRNFFRSLALGNKSGNSSVTSKDGTQISVRRSGEGPPMVLSHGTLDGMGGWAFVEPGLAQSFTVAVYDRRGRGDSGDTQPYEFDREVEDLAAVIDAAGEPVHVVGHSFGASVAMRAKLAGVPMRSLALYEPPMNGAAVPSGKLDEITRLVNEGQIDDAITAMASGIAGVTTDELGIGMTVPPVRKTLREGVLVSPREIEAAASLDWTGLPIDDTPVLLLRGALSDVKVYPQDDQIDSIATDIEVVNLAGQRHVAQTFAAPAFLAAVRDFALAH